MRLHYPLNANGAEDAGQLPWTDGVPSTGVEGSYPGHAIVTDVEAEILAAIDASGQGRNGADLTQITQAFARGIYLGQFSGSANTLTAAIPNNVVLLTLLAGIRLTGLVAATNTGGVTVTVVGIGSASGSVQAALLRRDGAALQAGDLSVGTAFDFRYDGSAFRLTGTARSELLATVANSGQFPTTPTGNVTIYVSATGNDATGTGTQAAPFATPAAAAAYASRRFFFAGYSLVIQIIGGGTFPAPNALPAIGGTLVIQGDTSNQGSTILAGAGLSGTPPVFATGGQVVLSGLTLQNIGSINHTLNAGPGAQVVCQYVTFTSTSASGYAHAQAAGGSVIFGPGCIIASSMAAIAIGTTGGTISIASNLAIANTPNFSQACFVATDRGGVALTPGVGFTGTGPTGSKFNASFGGIIKVFGAGINALPGSTAGSADASTGGYYA